MEKILLKYQLTQHMDHANSKQMYKNREVNKKKQCSNFWSNFRPFSTKLDHFQRNYNSVMWLFRRNGFRQCGSFDEMALDYVVLDEESLIWTKHPTKICHPGQNIPCCFCHPGHNIPCCFCHPRHNIPCCFCHPAHNIPCHFCHPGQNIPHSDCSFS